MLQTCFKYPDFSKPFILSTESSLKAICYVLSQLQDGAEHPVAYASSQISNAESNYSTFTEHSALVWATKCFMCYLYEHKFTVTTDHEALMLMLNLKGPSSRLTGWVLRLSEFDYDVIQKTGKKHTNADALSRVVNTVITPYWSRQEIAGEQQR